MDIKIDTRNFVLTPSLRDFVARRLRGVADGAEAAPATVHVSLIEETGNRQSRKVCVVAWHDGVGDARGVEGRAPVMREAVHRAVKRFRRELNGGSAPGNVGRA
jgi:hypothetical protein